jgi:hydroxyethylthiazole kinase-like uncharacterized protein yjeF
LSLHPETQLLVRELSAEIRKPLLIDGDGITAVAGEWTCIKRRKYPTILTPHMGEMTRITGQKMEALLANKIDVLQNTSHELNATIALKGAHTLIGYPDQRVFMNLSGNPGMATAGSGDVLTGAIAAMFGLGFPINDAVRMGVFVHGLAGDLAAQEKGEDGLIAGDIMDHLPAAMKMYREAFHSLVKDFYRTIYVI